MKSSGLSQLGRRSTAPPISWLMEHALARPQLISLAAGFTDNETLPVRQARDLLGSLLGNRKSGEPALQYGTTAGDARLRELTAQALRSMDHGAGGHGAYRPERMIISSGSQQMLYITVEALCDPGDIVILEDPTYFVFLGILQSHGVAARGVQIESDGLNLAHLEQVLERLKREGLLPRLKLLYLVSYYQNPTGLTTSFEKKSAALSLLQKYEAAAGHPIYLLEDAAYRELRFEGDDVKSAVAVKGHSDRVIYAGTYSKPFATGVRIGFGLLPEPVFKAALHIKGNHDFGTANFPQQLIACAVASGTYQNHIAVLRKRYAHKARIAVRAIKQHFPVTAEIWEPEGGMYVWVRLPKAISTGTDSKLFQSALDHDVLYVPGGLCYAADPTRRQPNHEMRISYGSAKDTNLKLGIERLGKVLREVMAKQGGPRGNR